MSKVYKTEHEWQKELSPEEYKITRLKGTEAPFTGEYWNTSVDGEYLCKCCQAELFSSDDKFDAGCGWPIFTRASVSENVAEETDLSHGMRRTEVLCQHCDAHLGHVFNDGPEPTGVRYCINSASIELIPKEAPFEDNAP